MGLVLAWDMPLAVEVCHYVFEGHSFFICCPATFNVDLYYSKGRLNADTLYNFYCHWCYPAVQHALDSQVARVFHLACGKKGVLASYTMIVIVLI